MHYNIGRSKVIKIIRFREQFFSQRKSSFAQVWAPHILKPVFVQHGIMFLSVYQINIIFTLSLQYALHVVHEFFFVHIDHLFKNVLTICENHILTYRIHICTPYCFSRSFCSSIVNINLDSSYFHILQL